MPRRLKWPLKIRHTVTKGHLRIYTSRRSVAVATQYRHNTTYNICLRIRHTSIRDIRLGVCARAVRNIAHNTVNIGRVIDIPSRRVTHAMPYDTPPYYATLRHAFSYVIGTVFRKML